MATITIHLPEPVYQRVKCTADTLSLSLERVIAEAVDLLLPAFERDVPSEWQTDLAALSLLNDAQLWKIAHQRMNDPQQAHLETLAETKKLRALTVEEQSALEHLMQAAQHLMLSKAEASRLLAQRGHVVFSTNSSHNINR